MTTLLAPFTLIGALVLAAVREAGEITLFAGRIIGKVLAGGRGSGQFLRQCAFVGVDSLPIILLTAFFTGGVLALQSFNGLDGGPLVNTQVAKLVALSMLRELGPVLAGLMLASRVGAAMAAELGTMRVTEQIDALQTLATNPLRYLVVPRVMACVLMLPLLVILANMTGIWGGYVVGTEMLGIPAHMYMNSTFEAISSEDLTMGLVKATVFGLLVGVMATYHGFGARGGAAGVGQATTRAVVYGAVAILVADYFITAMFV
ncbi:MAG: ABC transporter permease [Proteobacteria bacterium]|nr:ABC transporter permease [Pseudomonadota bacterium]